MQQKVWQTGALKPNGDWRAWRVLPSTVRECAHCHVASRFLGMRGLIESRAAKKMRVVSSFGALHLHLSLVRTCTVVI